MSIISRNVRWLYEKLVGHFYKRDPQLWVFGEWMGNRCCDNCLSMANYMAVRHPEVNIVWLSKKEADLSLLDSRVCRVVMDTKEARNILKCAGVAIMNQGFEDFGQNMSFLCDGALTVQLWHGVPWKRIGMDMYKHVGLLRKLYCSYVQRISRADMHLALSDSFADIMESAFYAKRDGIILAGYPRNASFYDPDYICRTRNKVLKLLNRERLISDDLKIITYMPTFRDKTAQVFSFEEMASNSRLKQILEEYNAVIVQKAHFVSYERNRSANEVSTDRILSMNEISAQELLAATDLLVTDYSSCFFDYLVLDRPIIHYIYDYQYYVSEDRGVYYKVEEVMCGDTPENVDQLLDALEINLRDPTLNEELRKVRTAEYLTYESTGSCEKIYQKIQSRLKLN